MADNTSPTAVLDGTSEVGKSREDDGSEAGLDKLACDFSTFLRVDSSKQLKDLDTIVDNLLARLEEFCTVTDQMRKGSKELLFSTVPNFHKRCEELKNIFVQIDNLEKFVGVVKETVEEMEEKVNLAEKELGNKNLKKILGSLPLPQFLSQKKQLQPYLKPEVKQDSWTSPEIFKTDDYITSIKQTHENEDGSTSDSIEDEFRP